MKSKKNHSKISNITQKWVEILKPFTKGYDRQISESKISKESGIPQQTVSRIMNKLAKNNIIFYTREGRSKLFHLEHKNLNTEVVLNIVENQKSLEFGLKHKRIHAIVRDLLSECESIIVFGSYASGKSDSNSDLDVVVLNPKSKDRMRRMLNRYTIEVNPHFLSYKELSNLIRKQNALSIEILQNHIIFGNSSKTIEVLRDEYK